MKQLIWQLLDHGSVFQPEKKIANYSVKSWHQSVSRTSLFFRNKSYLLFCECDLMLCYLDCFLCFRVGTEVRYLHP